MLITFKSRAYADVTMFGDVALKLIKLMGRRDTVRNFPHRQAAGRREPPCEARTCPDVPGRWSLKAWVGTWCINTGSVSRFFDTSECTLILVSAMGYGWPEPSLGSRWQTRFVRPAPDNAS
jgi:hypothetical protein